eukprot:CAMPEP_0182904980 /NCGR_PEP_ID=MMETSP0034_2-20130328/32551_1 /TAXON_ID=156128 /ORGANISM="Nephroselmis pyriformis, Strain CCMP717" /LENGTH=32 /DNA_ID= /DNA_START= /DNA_END= /DNA_ORIENTATION=
MSLGLTRCARRSGELLVGDTLMVPTGSAQLPW